MNYEKNNRRSSFTLSEKLLFLAGTLFCMVLITTAMMGGLFARYTTSDSGRDSARVAGFDVAVTSASNDVNIEYGVNPNSEGAYTITVTNNSEVTVTYNIKVVVEKAADSFDIQVALEGTVLDTSTTNELLFENVDYLSASEEKTHDLMFSVLDWGDFTKNQTGAASRTEELKFRVYVDVVQVD